MRQPYLPQSQSPFTPYQQPPYPPQRKSRSLIVLVIILLLWPLSLAGAWVVSARMHESYTALDIVNQLAQAGLPVYDVRSVGFPNETGSNGSSLTAPVSSPDNVEFHSHTLVYVVSVYPTINDATSMTNAMVAYALNTSDGKISPWDVNQQVRRCILWIDLSYHSDAAASDSYQWTAYYDEMQQVCS